MAWVYKMHCSYPGDDSRIFQLGHTYLLHRLLQNWIGAWQWIHQIVWMQSAPCAALMSMHFPDSMDSVDVGRKRICLQIVFDIHRKNLLQGCAD